MNSTLDFKETIERLVNKNATQLSGTEKWVDWDAIYSDLLDEGYDGSSASELLDEYMEERGFA
jgi:hypothetical protein